ncbi:putative bifunctional diguanylate cyclase/phosphodiesterase [Sporolactobacillus vineae]|uniref:putative bifunctional diguanylate cyclase/phosphodiesterase n=1 Tax=Sporolactobacillus vineae TaxID=444463 RepID=UPI000287C63E|nr:EAL domain-containing protein [Sporolactobacillus vineae]
MRQNQRQPPRTIPALLRQISRSNDIHEVEEKEAVISAYFLTPVLLLSGLVTSISGRTEIYTFVQSLIFFSVMLFCSAAILVVVRSGLHLHLRNHITGGLISLTILMQMFSGIDAVESVNITFLLIILVIGLMRVDLTLFLYTVLTSIGGGILLWVRLIPAEPLSDLFLHTVELTLFLVILVVGLALHRLFNNLLSVYFSQIIESRKQYRRLKLANHRLTESEKALFRLASRDSLTDLPNREKFLRELDRQCTRAEKPFVVVFIDLDNFKKINDTMGHYVGDRYLAGVAHQFSGCLTAGDVLGRIGGDEFAMIIRSISDKSEVFHYIEKLSSIFDTVFRVEEYQLRTSASFGVSLFPQDASSAVSLLRAADRALYQVKENGKNNICFFNDAMREQMSVEQRIDAALARAVADDELFVVYQPLFGLDSGALLGFEALVRWQMSKSEVIFPDVLIPAAEKTGLIDEIGLWVLRHVCRQIKEIERISGTHYPVSVNVSAGQMRSPQFAGSVTEIIREEQVDPGLIQLEMTESAFIHNLALAASIMAELKEAGVHLTVDHFGEGYSTFNYLRRLPIDTLKIGGQLIREMKQPEEASRLIRSIVTMMHHMSIRVISEGVETENQLSMLKASSCDGVQGFLLGKPMDEKQLALFIRNRAGC